MTTPVSGSVFTWVAYESAYEYVVTALLSEKNVLASTTEAGGVTATVGTGSVVTITGTTGTVVAGATNTGSGSGSSGSTTKNAAWGLQPRIPVSIGSAVVLGFYLFLGRHGFSKRCPTSCISIY